MTCTIQTALNKAPETLNRVHMVDTNGVLPFSVINNAMSVSKLLNVVITGKFIGMDGVFSGTGDVIPDDRHYSPCFNILSDRSAYLSLFPMNKTYNRCFALCASSWRARVLTADVCLVNFNVTIHLVMLLIHQFANHGKHTPSRLISNPNFTLKLFGTYPTASAGHQKHGMKPVTKWRGGLVKYRSGCGRYRMTAKLTGVIFCTSPMKVFGYLQAFRAVNTIGITTLEYALKASIIGRILLVKIFECVFCGFHFSLPNSISNRSIAQNVLYVKGYLPAFNADGFYRQEYPLPVSDAPERENQGVGA